MMDGWCVHTLAHGSIWIYTHHNLFADCKYLNIEIISPSFASDVDIWRWLRFLRSVPIHWRCDQDIQIRIISQDFRALSIQDIGMKSVCIKTFFNFLIHNFFWKREWMFIVLWLKIWGCMRVSRYIFGTRDILKKKLFWNNRPRDAFNLSEVSISKILSPIPLRASIERTMFLLTLIEVANTK